MSFVEKRRTICTAAVHDPHLDEREQWFDQVFPSDTSIGQSDEIFEKLSSLSVNLGRTCSKHWHIQRQSSTETMPCADQFFTSHRHSWTPTGAQLTEIQYFSLSKWTSDQCHQTESNSPLRPKRIILGVTFLPFHRDKSSARFIAMNDIYVEAYDVDELKILTKQYLCRRRYRAW